jgi:urease accessory protein
MGEAAIRITAADFVTPPELAGYALARDGAGRIGGVRLQLAAAGAKTYLADCYQQVPLRVLALSPGAEPPALVYLLNPTAGLLDGDAQLVDVRAEPGARAVITGQSATRIHPCLHGFSTQRWHIDVGAGAILVVLPGPALPFRGCRYFQQVLVDLADGAHVVWGDVWLPGRYARGPDSERFCFHTMVQELTVHRGGQLIFRDRFSWRGPWDAATAAWHFRDADAYGSLFSTVNQPKGQGDGEDKTGPACFATAEQHTCLRWLGPVQDVTAALARRALTLAALAEGHAEPWLLAGHDLAPNHWFSQAR